MKTSIERRPAAEQCVCVCVALSLAIEEI